MKQMLIPLIISGALLVATACAPETTYSPGEGSNVPTQDHVDDGIQLLGEGIGPLEITPDASSGVGENDSSGDQTGGNISSSGKQSASTSTDEQPGFIGSSAIGDSEVNRKVNWLTYLDSAFRFSIDYPEVFIILPETEPLNNIDSALEQRVRFQDIDLAEGDTAEYEIPKFTIEVFDLESRSLESYLDIKTAGAEREVITIGELVGYKVSFNQLRAPNVYYYFPGGGSVYKLTPLDDHRHAAAKHSSSSKIWAECLNNRS